MNNYVYVRSLKYDDISLLGERCELLVDYFEVVEDLLELSLRNLEKDLLLFFEVHLDVEHGLLDTLLLLGRDLNVEAPIEIAHLLQARAELVLHVLLGCRRMFSEQLEQYALELLLESAWELPC